jgi:hypothetical protein
MILLLLSVVNYISADLVNYISADLVNYISADFSVLSILSILSGMPEHLVHRASSD